MPYFINNSVITESTKTQVTDMTITVDEDGSRDVTIASAGGNLPAVSQGNIILLRGAVGNINKGTYQVTDPSPTTSSIQARKISGNAPETDLSIPPGAQFWSGGRMHAHDGKNINPNATEVGFDLVQLMDLKTPFTDDGGAGGNE